MPGLVQPERQVVFNIAQGFAIVRVKSLFTGERHELELPITQDQWNRWQSGAEYIQTAMPHLTTDQREFLLSGATPEEWHAAFGDPE